MLAHQRRKRQEVCTKVGEAPAHLLPPVGRPQQQQQQQQQPIGNSNVNAGGFVPGNQGQQPYPPVQNGPYVGGYAPGPHVSGSSAQYGDDAGNGYSHMSAGGGGASYTTGPVPPPVLFGDGRTNFLSPAVLDSAPPLPQLGAPFMAPQYSSDVYGPPREVRSAGHVPQSNAFAPQLDVVQATPRGPIDAASSPQRGSNINQPASSLVPQPSGPMYGRRAQTTDLNGRDHAAAQRQADYQREIEAQIAEARARKQQEKDRIKREEDALERRVQEDRTRLATKERQEREKEVKDREDKEAAQFAKRRGGNHKPAAPDTTDHKNDLQRQIDEKRRRKEEEEEAKRKADELYERRYGGAAAAPSPPLVQQPHLAGGDGRASVSVAAGAMGDGGMQQGGFNGAQGGPNFGLGVPLPPSEPLPWGQPPLQHQQQQLGAPSQQPPWLQPSAAGNSQDVQLSKMKDEIFSMLVDQHRQQQSFQQQFPPMNFPPQLSSPAYHMASPSYAPPPPSNMYGGFGGAAPQYFGGAGQYPMDVGRQPAPQPFQPAPQPFQPFQQNTPDLYAPPVGRYSQQQQGGTQDVLRRFLEEDRSEVAQLSAAQHAPPQDDISMELPTEHVKHVGRRRPF